MIKFFGGIRQQLLTDPPQRIGSARAVNKTGKPACRQAGTFNMHLGKLKVIVQGQEVITEKDLKLNLEGGIFAKKIFESYEWNGYRNGDCRDLVCATRNAAGFPIYQNEERE